MTNSDLIRANEYSPGVVRGLVRGLVQIRNVLRAASTFPGDNVLVSDERAVLGEARGLLEVLETRAEPISGKEPETPRYVPGHFVRMSGHLSSALRHRDEVQVLVGDDGVEILEPRRPDS